MNTIRRFRLFPLAFLLVGLLLLSGCPAGNPNSSQSTPAAPTPPQITVANAVNALAQAVDGAVTATIAARDAGKVDAADVRAIEAYAVAIAKTGRDVNAELRSADTWPVQRGKILQIVAGAGLGTLKAHISPGAQLMVSSMAVLVNEISTAVGGPAL